MSTQITCPQCQCRFPVDEVLTKEVENQLQQKFLEEKTQLRQQLQNLTQQKETEKQQLKQQLEQTFKNQQVVEKKLWQEELKKQWQQEQNNQLELLNQQVKNRDEQLQKMREQESKLLQEKDKWELEKQDFILEGKRKLEAEREKIVEQISQKVAAEQVLVLAEKDKKIADYQKEVLEMKRKLDQGSQQLQGEVLELMLEENLKREFPMDLVEAVGKGVNGADVKQVVIDKNGQNCGTIIWESKRTKNWTEGWVTKLKEDQRQEKANLAVLVSTALPPKQEKKILFYNGIWLCEPSGALQLAMLLRFNLIRVHQVMTSQENKDEKLEALYRYLTGPEFVQKIEALMETFGQMKQDLDKERRVLTKRLSEREQQLNKLIENTALLYGGLQGVTQNGLPKVQLLELE